MPEITREELVEKLAQMAGVSEEDAEKYLSAGDNYVETLPEEGKEPSLIEKPHLTHLIAFIGPLSLSSAFTLKHLGHLALIFLSQSFSLSFNGIYLISSMLFSPYFLILINCFSNKLF